MDVILLGQKSIRVKGKNSSIIVNPTLSINKVEADAILVTEDDENFSDKKVEGFRIILRGPGEYEINGAKVSAIKVEGKMVAKLDVDRVKVLISNGLSLEKVQDKIDECDILLINADSDFNHSVVTSFEPSVVMVYGEKSEDVAKSLGKDSSEKTTKFSTTFEKLPSEMQVYLLA